MASCSSGGTSRFALGLVCSLCCEENWYRVQMAMTAKFRKKTIACDERFNHVSLGPFISTPMFLASHETKGCNCYAAHSMIMLLHSILPFTPD